MMMMMMMRGVFVVFRCWKGARSEGLCLTGQAVAWKLSWRGKALLYIYHSKLNSTWQSHVHRSNSTVMYMCKRKMKMIVYGTWAWKWSSSMFVKSSKCNNKSGLCKVYCFTYFYSTSSFFILVGALVNLYFDTTNSSLVFFMLKLWAISIFWHY